MQLPKWLESIFERVKSLNKAFPEVFIFSLITIGVIATASFIIGRNKIDVAEVKFHHHNADSSLHEGIKTSRRLDSINLCKNLKTVYSYIDEIKKPKLYLAIKFQQFFILCFTIGIFFVTLTAIVAFVVTKKGWDHSSRPRKGLLLSCAFYGLLLTAFPKLFDQDQNYRNHYSDYNALSNTQLFIFKRLNPYMDKQNNILVKTDSTLLDNAMDTAIRSIMLHSNIDISLDKKQLDQKKIEL